MLWKSRASMKTAHSLLPTVDNGWFTHLHHRMTYEAISSCTSLSCSHAFPHATAATAAVTSLNRYATCRLPNEHSPATPETFPVGLPPRKHPLPNTNTQYPHLHTCSHGSVGSLSLPPPHLPHTATTASLINYKYITWRGQQRLERVGGSACMMAVPKPPPRTPCHLGAAATVALHVVACSATGRI